VERERGFEGVDRSVNLGEILEEKEAMPGQVTDCSMGTRPLEAKVKDFTSDLLPPLVLH
jgi:hypothetical protein